MVWVRLAARLGRVVEEGLPEDVLAAALRSLRGVPTSEAELVGLLARIVEDQVLRGTEPDPGRGPRRALYVDADADRRRVKREDVERVVDARVAGLDREEHREVLLLRDYCGADWEQVRRRFGLLSIDAAQELYRRAHAHLARSLRRNLRCEKRERDERP